MIFFFFFLIFSLHLFGYGRVMGNIFFILYDKAKTMSLLQDFMVEIYGDDT
jgi:hypothetical protein